MPCTFDYGVSCMLCTTHYNNLMTVIFITSHNDNKITVITCIWIPCCPSFPDAAGIFTPTKVLPSDAIAAAIELLARATSCRDQGFDGQDSGAQHELGEEGTEEEAAAAARMDTTREALQAALDTAQRALTKTGLQDAMVIYQVECGKSMGLACWLVIALTQHVARVTSQNLVLQPHLLPMA